MPPRISSAIHPWKTKIRRWPDRNVDQVRKKKSFGVFASRLYPSIKGKTPNQTRNIEMSKEPILNEQNINAKPGTKDASKVYVFTPFNYRDTQAVLKAAGATWKGSQWEMDKAVFETNRDAIVAAAKVDNELGKDGRKTREMALKAAAPAKPEKKELSAEEKAAVAEAARQRVLERDSVRVPVLAGAVAEGGNVSVNGEDVVVTRVSAAFELDMVGAADMNARFDTEFAAGDEVAYAYFEAPEAKKEVENEGPGM